MNCIRINIVYKESLIDLLKYVTGQLGVVDCYINLNSGPKVMK